MTPLQIVRERLENRDLRPKRSGTNGQYQALCPAHDDRTPSLSIGTGNDGRVLLHCQAGCCTDAVLDALGLTTRDLYPETTNTNGHDEIIAVYKYTDENGRALFEVCRTGSKRFFQRKPDGTNGVQGVRRVPYRLPRVIAAVKSGETIYLPEGEKDVHALERAGVTATCNPGGAGKWRDEYSELLRGAKIVIIADADDAGRTHAQQAARSLRGTAAEVMIVEPAVGKDVSDHLAASRTLDELVEQPGPQRDPGKLSDLLVEDILSKNPELSREDLEGADSVKDLMALLGSKKNVASEIVSAVKSADVVLFHDDSKRGFASFECDGHRETWPIRSRAFKLFTRRAYFEATEKTPTGSAVDDATMQLESEAMFAGEELPVYLRIAEVDGCIHLDLGDKNWRCVQITREGWTVLDQHPVRFIRTGAMQAMPEPVRGGSINKLRAFLNVEDDGWLLVVGFLVACFRPGRPFPVLQLHGEHGTAKSTAARVLRKLTDPNKAPLRAAPKSDDDLMVSASRSWVMTFENVSRLEPSLSDAICRLSTGGGLSKRMLFTDDDEVVLDATRPVIVTSINEVTTAPDLLDRAVLVELAPLDDADRIDEESFWQTFDDNYPAILGALCDAVAGALEQIASVQIDKLPRMADFAKWGTAAEKALGWKQGAFVTAYTENRSQSNEVAIESSPIGAQLRKVADHGFEGTTTELLELLNTRVDEKVTRAKTWPKTARGLAGQITRLAPNLRKLGYVVEHDRAPDRKRTRILELRRKGC